MNKKLPYEQKLEGRITDLPLPDENLAWEDMRKRLEEDGDDRIIPFWLRGCGLWGLLGVLLFALSWWIIRQEKWWNKKQETESVSDSLKKEIKTDSDENINYRDTSYSINNTDNTNIDTGSYNQNDSRIISPIIPGIKNQNVQVKKNKDSAVQVITNKTSRQITGRLNKPPIKKNEKNNHEINQKEQPVKPVKPITEFPRDIKKDSTENDLIKTNNEHFIPKKNTLVEEDDEQVQADSIKKVIDSLNKPGTEPGTNKKKKDSTTQEKVFFSAGIGLQQQLPINGQKLVPYSTLGRKNLLTDYIPSVYFQANKPRKWFANIGFRYGAPQYNKEFIYDQKINNAGSNNIVTTTTLKKSFYHQVPLSFNYYVLPGWSVGTGIVWNKFYGAVADRQIIERNPQRDSLLSKELISIKKDSAQSFSKSHFQGLLQTEYNWKRFYFGVRYSFGLQPYIKFTLNGNTFQKEKSSSLQFFIRYELWRSKKK
ncbi:MAG: hypothetical protein WDN26_07510 [Chitinophagaceae bacterium]